MDQKKFEITIATMHIKNSQVEDTHFSFKYYNSIYGSVLLRISNSFYEIKLFF